MTNIDELSHLYLPFNNSRFLNRCRYQHNSSNHNLEMCRGNTFRYKHHHTCLHWSNTVLYANSRTLFRSHHRNKCPLKTRTATTCSDRNPGNTHFHSYTNRCLRRPGFPYSFVSSSTPRFHHNIRTNLSRTHHSRLRRPGCSTNSSQWRVCEWPCRCRHSTARCRHAPHSRARYQCKPSVCQSRCRKRPCR